MESELKSVKRLEKLLDRSISLPGGIKIGLDGIIGLIPGVGDVLTTSVSSFIIYKAIKLKAPKIIIARMVLNTIIDTVLGAIPIVGDVFDFIWKSNVKNAKLLQDHVEKPGKVKKNSYLLIGISLILLIAALGLTLWLAIVLIKYLFGLVF